MNRRLTAIVERDGDGYVALCPELDGASQGDSVTEARSNLEEALTSFQTAFREGIISRCAFPDVPGRCRRRAAF